MKSCVRKRTGGREGGAYLLGSRGAKRVLGDIHRGLTEGGREGGREEG